MSIGDRIAELILNQGNIQANQLNTVAAAQARAQELNAALQAEAQRNTGQIWGQTIQNLGQLPGQVFGQMQQAQAQNLLNQQRQQQLQIGAMNIAQAQREQKGRTALASMLQGDQLAPGDVGPRQESYLDENNLFDIPKLTQALSSGGYGDLAPDLLKGAEGINDAVVKHQTAVQALNTQAAIMNGYIAAGAIKLHQAGAPWAEAIDGASAPGRANGSITPHSYAQMKSWILSLPDDQIAAALTRFMDAAAQVAPKTKVGAEDTEYDIFNRPTIAGRGKPINVPPNTDVIQPPPPGSNQPPTLLYRGQKPDVKLGPEEQLLSFSQALNQGPLPGQIGAAGQPPAFPGLAPPSQPPAGPGAPTVIATGLPKVGTSLPEQLDAARARGDTAAALRIAESMRIAAENSKDPEQIALARARLQALQLQLQLQANQPTKYDVHQDALEAQYHKDLFGHLESGRAGDFGVQNAKIGTTIHLMSMFEQNKDKNGNYQIPPSMETEAAIGLANLISGTGQASEQTIKDIQTATLKHDMAKALSYVLNRPVSGTPQEVAKLYVDSILRQGEAAETIRDNYFKSGMAAAPTGLDPVRKANVERGLAPLTSVKRKDWIIKPDVGTTTTINGKPVIWRDGPDGLAWYPNPK